MVVLQSYPVCSTDDEHLDIRTARFTELRIGTLCGKSHFAKSFYTEYLPLDIETIYTGEKTHKEEKESTTKVRLQLLVRSG